MPTKGQVFYDVNDYVKFDMEIAVFSCVDYMKQ